MRNRTLYSQLGDHADVVREDEEVEESIKEEIDNEPQHHRREQREMKQTGGNPFKQQSGAIAGREQPTGTYTDLTTNTIISNHKKLQRGVSREGVDQLNNGTLLNFGLHGNSTRSSMMKTPLMFGQNTKLRDVKPEMATNQKDREKVRHMQHQTSLYSRSSHMFSPQSNLG